MNFPVVLEAFRLTRSGDVINKRDVIKNQTEADLFIAGQRHPGTKIRTKQPPFILEAWLDGHATHSQLSRKEIYHEAAFRKFIEQWGHCRIDIIDLNADEIEAYNKWVSTKPEKTLGGNIGKLWVWLYKHPTLQFWSLVVGMIAIPVSILLVTNPSFFTCNRKKETNSNKTNDTIRLQPKQSVIISDTLPKINTPNDLTKKRFF